MNTFLLRTIGVTKQYGSHKVLQGINLDIYAGEIVSLLGVNGAGKTTLSSIIATLHPPTAGDIEYKGMSIYTDLPAFRKQLGYCPQKPNLMPFLTIQQNFIYAARFYNLDPEYACARIAYVVDHFDLSPFLDKKVSVLSGGYQQRCMIARSLLHEPSFIILDEPTVGLDPHIRRELWGMIRDLKKAGITVLLTTHYLDEAEKLSDRVCILDKGHIRLIDTPERLLSDFKHNNLEDMFIELLKVNN